jgi:hypothetical protein
MNNEIKYIPTKEAIIGYSDSSIAKTESNDCVVRAIASSFEMHYDEAHKLVAKIWFRSNREGTRNFVAVCVVWLTIKFRLMESHSQIWEANTEV